jgi:squalene cyclase
MRRPYLHLTGTTAPAALLRYLEAHPWVEGLTRVWARGATRPHVEAVRLIVPKTYERWNPPLTPGVRVFFLDHGWDTCAWVEINALEGMKVRTRNWNETREDFDVYCDRNNIQRVEIAVLDDVTGDLVDWADAP